MIKSYRKQVNNYNYFLLPSKWLDFIKYAPSAFKKKASFLAYFLERGAIFDFLKVSGRRNVTKVFDGLRRVEQRNIGKAKGAGVAVCLVWGGCLKQCRLYD